MDGFAFHISGFSIAMILGVGGCQKLVQLKWIHRTGLGSFRPAARQQTDGFPNSEASSLGRRVPFGIGRVFLVVSAEQAQNFGAQFVVTIALLV